MVRPGWDYQILERTFGILKRKVVLSLEHSAIIITMLASKTWYLPHPLFYRMQKALEIKQTLSQITSSQSHRNKYQFFCGLIKKLSNRLSQFCLPYSPQLVCHHYMGISSLHLPPKLRTEKGQKLCLLLCTNHRSFSQLLCWEKGWELLAVLPVCLECDSTQASPVFCS